LLLIFRHFRYAEMLPLAATFALFASCRHTLLLTDATLASVDALLPRSFAAAIFDMLI